MLRYFASIAILFYIGVLLWYWNTLNEFYNKTFHLLQIWTLSVEVVLVQIILQMRLYALYNRSRRVLFVVVLGFVIEIAVSSGTLIRITIFIVNNVLSPTANVASFPTSEEIDIYLSYSAMGVYELLLFSFALWASIQCLRSPSPANRIGTRSLRVVLIQGNVMYFLAIWLYLVVFVTVIIAAPAQYLDIATNLACSLFAITGCQMILHIRSAASLSCTSTIVSQYDSREICSLVVFRDRATYISTNDDIA